MAGVVVRFDAEPARAQRLPSEIEKEVGMVQLGSEEFEKLLGSKRLRVRVLTVLNTVVDEDISLEGITDAHEVIVGPECQ